MAFRDLEDFNNVFVAFSKDLAVDDKTGALAKTGLVIVFRVTDLGVDLVTDTTVEPKPGAAYDVYTTPRFEGKATVIYETTSEIIDRVYTGALPPLVALARGDVRAYGAHLQAMVKGRKALDNAIRLYRTWRAQH